MRFLPFRQSDIIRFIAGWNICSLFSLSLRVLLVLVGLHFAGEEILHPLRVMLACETPVARMAPVLHDVVEDSEGAVTLETLRAE